MTLECYSLTGQDKKQRKEMNSGGRQREIGAFRRSSNFAPPAKPRHD